jgi:transposase
MGRPTCDVDQYQEEISDLYQSGQTVDSIARELLSEYNFDVNPRTIQRRLKEWGLTRRIRVKHTNELENQILVLFYQCGLSDKDMLYVLQKQGYRINARTLGNLRRRIGLKRRIDPNKLDDVEDAIKTAVQNELNEGSIEGLGRGHLYTYFRSKMHNVSR